MELDARWEVRSFAYDWRESLDRSAARLDGELRAFGAGGAVHIVAHSMGGLVSRTLAALFSETWSAIDDPESHGRGGRLVMLGTPNRGSFDMARALVGADPLVRRLALADLEHDLDEVLTILATFPGLAHLLPLAHGGDRRERAREALRGGDVGTASGRAGSPRRGAGRAHPAGDDDRPGAARLRGGLRPPDAVPRAHRQARGVLVPGDPRRGRTRAPRAGAARRGRDVLGRRGPRRPRQERGGARRHRRPASARRDRPAARHPAAAAGRGAGRLDPRGPDRGRRGRGRRRGGGDQRRRPRARRGGPAAADPAGGGPAGRPHPRRLSGPERRGPRRSSATVALLVARRGARPGDAPPRGRRLGGRHPRGCGRLRGRALHRRHPPERRARPRPGRLRHPAGRHGHPLGSGHHPAVPAGDAARGAGRDLALPMGVPGRPGQARRDRRDGPPGHLLPAGPAPADS